MTIPLEEITQMMLLQEHNILNVMVINICPQKKISYIPCAVVVYSNI